MLLNFQQIQKTTKKRKWRKFGKTNLKEENTKKRRGKVETNNKEKQHKIIYEIMIKKLEKTF